MTVYKATNEETGEVIEGGARDLSKKIGIPTDNIYKANSTNYKVRGVWLITSNSNKSSCGKTDKITQKDLDEWERVTAPYKAASKKGCKKTDSRIKLRTMYNVGIY